MDTEKVHFGGLIEKLVRSTGSDVDSEASKWGFQRNNLYKTFRKKDVSTALLRKACQLYGVQLTYFLGTSKSVSQVGNANVGGSGNATFTNNSNNYDNNKMEVLLNENQHLKTQNQLLKDMVELLKSKT